MRIKTIFQFVLTGIMSVCLLSCSDSDSYSNLLKKEEKATNWYLSNQKVMLDLPSGDNIITGKDAPFYKLDDDGYVYMQVVDKGDMNSRPEKGDLVYFRYNRLNLRTLYEADSEVAEGNDNDMQLAAASFVYDDYTLSSTVKYGKGIQMALSYLRYNSEVNLVLRSYYGFTSDQSQCIPYLINIRYFKTEY